MKIEMGIGWMRDPDVPDGLVSAGPADYVAEIERLRTILGKIACSGLDAWSCDLAMNALNDDEIPSPVPADMSIK